MPLPKFKFDDPGLGMPRQPVPVRFACMAADWPPATFAEIVSGTLDECPPLLSVQEFNLASGYFGEIVPARYEEFRRLDAPPSEALAAFPANHFVWSDDLVQACSDYIDRTWDRETAFEQRAGIRWNPALGDCEQVVSESVDLSGLAASSDNVHIFCDKGSAWAITFEGLEHPYDKKKGFAYLRHLVLNAHKKFSAEQLRLEVDKPPAEHVLPSKKKDSAAAAALEEDSPIAVRSTVDSPLGPIIDPTAIAQYKEHLEQLNEELSEAKKQGDFDRAAKLEDEIELFEKHLSAGTDHKGRPRKIPGSSEKIRKAISRAISRAYDEIEPYQPSLASHFRRHLKPGLTFEYSPPASFTWSS